MKTVILAAGLGLRLKPRTESIPKCLISVHGVPLLERQLRLLEASGAESVSLVLGYKAHLVKAFLEEKRFSIPIELFENEHYENTNNMVSLQLAKEKVLGHDFLLLNGDTIFRKSLLDTILESDGPICPFDSEEFEPEELKVLLEEGRAKKIMPKGSGRLESDGSTLGIFKFDPAASTALFEDIDGVVASGRRNEWFEFSLDRIFKTICFKGLDLKGEDWMEIDDENDYQKALSLFSKVGV